MLFFFSFPLSRAFTLENAKHNGTSGQQCEEGKGGGENRREEAGVREKSIFETATATATPKRHTLPYTHARTILRQARCQAKLMARCAYARLATRAADSKKASKKKEKAGLHHNFEAIGQPIFFLILAYSSAHCHCFSSSLKGVKRKGEKKENSVSEACVLGLRIFAILFVFHFFFPSLKKEELPR